MKPQHKRERYQSGSLTIESRTNGPDVWVYRWRESYGDGTRIKRKRVIGTTDQHRTRTAAQKAVDGLRLDINAIVSVLPITRTVSDLIAHYTETELESGRHTARVQQTYRHNLEDIIRPKWGGSRIQDVKAIEVEKWLEQLPYAPSTKTKVKGGVWDVVPPRNAIRVAVCQPRSASEVKQQAPGSTGHSDRRGDPRPLERTGRTCPDRDLARCGNGNETG